MNIGIDIDDVLLQYIPAILAYRRTAEGVDLTEEQITDHYLWKVPAWNLNREDTIQKVHDFYKTEFFKNMPPVLGSRDGISLLGKYHDLFAISSRPFELEEDTRKQLERCFSGKLSDLTLCNAFPKDGSKKVSKADACIEKKIDVMIEDALPYAEEIANQGISVLLIDKPWNKQGVFNKKVTRTYSWLDVVDKINKNSF